eukprot:scaffold2109_cov123-Isochrysis_galbana.AAC.3
MSAWVREVLPVAHLAGRVRASPLLDTSAHRSAMLSLRSRRIFSSRTMSSNWPTLAHVAGFTRSSRTLNIYLPGGTERPSAC